MTDSQLQPADRPAVVLNNLTIRVGHRDLVVSTSAEFPAGEISLIIGCSGAGKSTLLRVLSGELPNPDAPVVVEGDVRVAGRPLGHSETRIGIVYQDHALFDELSPTQNVAFAQDHRGPVARSHKQLGPAEWLDQLHIPANVPTSRLSGGQQQRLAIARTMAYDPDMVLYDEPTSGLDPDTAAHVAGLIRDTHVAQRKTSLVVTHDYEALPAIADRIFLLDAAARVLREIPRERWSELRDLFKQAPVVSPTTPSKRPTIGTWLAHHLGRFLENSSRAIEACLSVPFWLIPVWKSPRWGLRFAGHYLRLVAGMSAIAYIAIAGLIIGFVATYFTFRFLPFAQYTEPLLIENLLGSIGFSLYRILVPVLATLLIASRCGAAVAADVGGKTYGRQMDALRTLGAPPKRYLLTGILYAFLVGTPWLSMLAYAVAHATSLAVFTSIYPEWGPDFWHLHFHKDLLVPQGGLYVGTGWLTAKLLACGLGTALISYHCGARPKSSSADVSRGITGAILWSTLLVLLIHFGFTFVEFD
ncbi:MAG: ATP-binding cassette domain-containing protein [Planctomycetaceae bacterium]